MTSPTPPFVTVIMPIRNEADFIARSLGAVLEQDYPALALEVIVADGMSSDETRSIIQAMASHSAIPVQIIDNPRKIVPTGFNLALEKARGAIIVRVDGHTIIATDYVSQCVQTLQRQIADNVGGRMDAVGRGHFGEAVALATSSPFGVGNARFHYSTQEDFVDTVYMGAWWQKTFTDIGGFDEDFVRNQDDEFNYRLRAAGKKILLNPAIKSAYYNRSTPYTLAKQYYQYGLYKVRVLQKHPRQMSLRQFIPPAFVLTVLLGALIAPFLWQIRLLWLALLSLYLLANLTASSIVSYRTKWLYLLLLPPIFAILHFSYGAGFLHGLLKFRHYWKQP